jgi:glycosyltransferase involved in cell wall biosynthesis
VKPALVIPALNEAATIREVARRALAELDQVIVVDDGSTDGTAQALAGLPVTVLVNPANQGKAASLWRGATHAIASGATTVFTLDGDGQHDPADLQRLLGVAALYPEAILIGSRLHARERIPPSRYRANRFANFWISWAAGMPLLDTQSGFRAYPPEVFRRLRVRHDRWASFVFESEVLVEAARAGMAIICVPISVRYETGARRSHFRPVADAAKIGMMLTRSIVGRAFHLPGLWRSLQRGRSHDERTPRLP